MNHRALAVSGLCLSVAILAACDKGDKEPTAEPGASAAAPSPALPPAAATDKTGTPSDTTGSGDKAGAPPPSTAAAPAPTGSATITNGQKSVKADGQGLKLENETGKGSVTTSDGKTTITGKSGKSVSIPSLK